MDGDHAIGVWIHNEEQHLEPCGLTTKMQDNWHQVGVQDQVQVQRHIG